VCGAGATRLRDGKSFEILSKAEISVIKGNASEIARIAGEDIRTRGVDSGEVDKDLRKLAKALAAKKGSTIVITGKEDIIAGAKKLITVKNGHEMMGKIVGTGCMATSVIGTFAAVEKDLVKAAAAGLACFGIAGELAAKDSRGTGSFKTELFDHLYNLNTEKIEKLQRVE
jgi:hydroxyethylthiazole kinase